MLPQQQADPSLPPSSRTGLCAIPGGYDINAWPIRVAPDPRETSASWLRRASHRYGLSPRAFLKALGVTKQIGSLRAAVRYTREVNATIEHQLRIQPDDLAALDEPTPLDRVTQSYLQLYHRDSFDRLRGSRFCPECLLQNPPLWHRTWQNPYLAICLHHAKVLLDACPGCGLQPFSDTGWLAHDAAPWRCPSRHPHGRQPGTATPGGPRPYCGHDLRTATSVHATPEQCAAQRSLLDLAALDSTITAACGITASADVIVHAYLDLLDALGSTETKDAASALATHLPMASRALQQPDITSGASAIAQLLSPTGPHAPIVANQDLYRRPHNPILGALQLRHYEHRLTPAAHLTFRCGAELPFYPMTTPYSDWGFLDELGITGPDGQPLQHPESAWNRDWPLLRLACHGRLRPPLDPAFIPQVLWPGAVPVLPDDSVIHAAVGALALGRIGNTRQFGMIALDLALPTSAATNVGATWRRLQRSNQWKEFLEQLDHLHRLLEESPPPINYRDRRILGNDVQLLIAALQDSAERNNLQQPGLRALRRFWELFTGGDIAYAPEPLAAAYLSVDYAEYAGAREHVDEENAALFHGAQETIHANAALPANGPLAWQPP